MEQCAALMIKQPEALRGRFQALRRRYFQRSGVENVKVTKAHQKAET